MDTVTSSDTEEAIKAADDAAHSFFDSIPDEFELKTFCNRALAWHGQVVHLKELVADYVKQYRQDQEEIALLKLALEEADNKLKAVRAEAKKRRIQASGREWKEE